MQRLNGKDTMFVTGTDEHGEKIALAAQKRDMSPQEHCDDIAATYKCGRLDACLRACASDLCFSRTPLRREGQVHRGAHGCRRLIPTSASRLM